MVAALGPILDRCDVPRIAASGLAWTTFAKYRGSQGVLLTGLFQDSELSAWGSQDADGLLSSLHTCLGAGQ